MKSLCNCGRRINIGNTCVCKQRKVNKQHNRDDYMHSSEWTNKSLMIRQMYNGHCQRCWYKYHRITRTQLSAHHIYSRLKYPQYKRDNWNLICVCMSCNNALKHVADGHIDWEQPHIDIVKVNDELFKLNVPDDDSISPMLH